MNADLPGLALYGLPLLYALLIWWFSTGLVLYLDGLPRSSYRWSLGGATLLLAAALYGLAVGRDDTSVGGAYLAFTCGLLVWGWQELSYYTGCVTGPWQQPCPAGCTGWRRFGLAIQTSLYHELAIIITGGVIVALTWGGANQIGTWTFLLLWWMRWSAKLNVFLGVRNLNEDWLPAHLRYLTSFFSRQSMNPLFPFSVTLATAVLALLLDRALAADAGAFETTGLSLLAALLALAILEHWLLILPLPTAALWDWGLRSHRTEPTDTRQRKPV